MTRADSAPRTGNGGGDRHLIRVCAPSAHAGIGDALRRAFSAPLPANNDREFALLLERC